MGLVVIPADVCQACIDTAAPLMSAMAVGPDAMLGATRRAWLTTPPAQACVAVVMAAADRFAADVGLDLCPETLDISVLHNRPEAQRRKRNLHVDRASTVRWRQRFTAVAQLSDPSSYDGCLLQMRDHAGGWATAPTGRGTVTVFPSYETWHRVTPITRGERWVLVAFVDAIDPSSPRRVQVGTTRRSVLRSP